MVAMLNSTKDFEKYPGLFNRVVATYVENTKPVGDRKIPTPREIEQIVTALFNNKNLIGEINGRGNLTILATDPRTIDAEGNVALKKVFTITNAIEVAKETRLPRTRRVLNMNNGEIKSVATEAKEKKPSAPKVADGATPTAESGKAKKVK